MDQYEDKILDHNYDGIQEYDNPMPGWWKAIFLLTVIWAGFYLVGIELNVLPRYGDDLKEGQEEVLAMRRAYEKAQPPVIIDEVMLAAAIIDPVNLSKGASVFATSCASCHGAAAQGGIGPNLTDDYWLYGQEPMEVHATISKGAPKGMPAWEGILPPDEIVALVAYVASTRGTNPADAKEAQGDRLDPPATKDAKAE
jgi:cytochrome c oxidase cbb3-type subunit 3